jgi:hypothetical protein
VRVTFAIDENPATVYWSASSTAPSTGERGEQHRTLGRECYRRLFLRRGLHCVLHVVASFLLPDG